MNLSKNTILNSNATIIIINSICYLIMNGYE